jgi:hypothetical protein
MNNRAQIQVCGGSLLLICCVLALIQTGCILGKQHPAATQPATAGDPKSAQPAYWLDQPAVTHITSPDFDRLWNACRDAAQADGFTIDRTDYREGLLTTLPLVSKQAYELWKGDVVSSHELSQSTLGTLRRTIRIDIRRLPEGGFEATPKVLVERDSLIERRITSVYQYQEVFAIQQIDVQRQIEHGTDIPAEYWYPVARDTNLELQLADLARQRLR